MCKKPNKQTRINELRGPLCFLQKEEVRRRHIRLHMEGALTARDKVGVQDFVLLDAYTSEAAFLDNLRKRFSENLIYVT